MVTVLGILCLKYFQKKVKKKKLKNFFRHIIKSMASKEGDVNVLENKLAEIEINHDDLSTEEIFLKELDQKLREALQDCVVSYYIRKKSTAICCETFLLTVEANRKLLSVIDKLISDMFFYLMA